MSNSYKKNSYSLLLNVEYMSLSNKLLSLRKQVSVSEAMISHVIMPPIGVLWLTHLPAMLFRIMEMDFIQNLDLYCLKTMILILVVDPV